MNRQILECLCVVLVAAWTACEAVNPDPDVFPGWPFGRRCRPFGCMNFCPGGRALDDKGCPTCACRSFWRLPISPRRRARSVDSAIARIPPARCPRYRCSPDLSCPYGLQKLPNGCPTCKCLPKPECARRHCEIFCLTGYRKDEHGCDTCACNIPKCPMIHCPISKCVNGFVFDKNGCNTCRCKVDTCPLLKCFRYCPGGYVKDRNGCQTCMCKNTMCPLRLKCPPRYIEVGCKTDGNGCRTCRCMNLYLGEEDLYINRFLKNRLENPKRDVTTK